MSAKQRRRHLNQQGAMIIVTAAGLLLLLGIAGLVLDLGQLYVIKSELQRAADAGAMAGVRSLYPYPLNEATLPLTPKCSEALNMGRTICQDNLVDGSNAVIADIRTGFWNWANSSFIPGCASSPFSNALTLTVSRNNISWTLMGVFGLAPGSLQATSLAVMDWVGKLEQGAAFVLVIGKDYVQKGDVIIYLNPDPLDGGGWYAKDPDKPTNNLIRNYLADPASIPALKVGDTVNLNNGAWGNVMSILADNWVGKTVWAPVVDTQKFNKSAPVLGFAALNITEVNTKGHKYIRGNVPALSDVPQTMSDPGGANYGLLSAPRLVQ
ncbi:MAG: pilus assembly protein TadG-related protein [Deltaproteobacteria bacterium]|nr:pilus assembly protein TadG-related protein [Deltaproteobacteria bacterium]